jgi:hypothetical protein
MGLFAERNYAPNEFICWYDGILIPELDARLMDTSYMANFNTKLEINARSYETPGKYTNNVKESNHKLNVTWSKAKNLPADLKIEPYKIAKEVLYIKNRDKVIEKSSEFFLNYGCSYWSGHKLIMKHGVAATNKDIKEAL